MARGLLTRRRVIAILAGLVLGGIYIHGTFDRALSGVGLNFHECARNGLGVTFCGQELDEYREHIAQAKKEGEEAKQKVEAAGARSEDEYLATAKHEQEEVAAREAQIQREGAEAQRRIREGG